MRRISVSTFPPAEISIVFLEVPLEPDDFRVPLEREDVRRDSIEKPPIVTDDDRASGEAKQRLLERAQRIDVEIVRRFVEQQYVAARLEQLREVQPVALTAR